MKTLIVGSRDSALAVAQAMTVVRALQEKLPHTEVRLLTMKTTGDRILDRTLDQVGGKGLFVKELDAALRDRRADLTVHSLKDVPMEVPEDLPLLGFSRREDPRDVLVLRSGADAPEAEQPIGSASLRRSLQLKKLFPGFEVKPVRGNLQTRLRKLDEGQYGALVLAAAGLKRLGLESRISRYFSPEEMIPAAGQGILAIQGRAGEEHPWLEELTDPDATAAALCERAFARTLGGGCTSPVCAYARPEGDRIHLTGLYWEESSGRWTTGEDWDERSRAEALGFRLAERLRNESFREGNI
jgi:hydroxymethylbilane synthase